ncbi:MAG: hypothetical protein AB7M12_12850 [Hyphomonadaceae bacterium]
MDVDWPAGWLGVSEAESAALAVALSRALAPGHILHARRFTPIARREDQEDVLLLMDDGEVAEMHMSWAGAPATPEFPGALLFIDLDQWRKAQF